MIEENYSTIATMRENLASGNLNINTMLMQRFQANVAAIMKM
jgi:hypothetical protein